MRICLAGHFGSELDEGVRSVGTQIGRELIKRTSNDILMININKMIGWKKVIAFNPDVIHFILSPTVGGLWAAKLLSLLNPGAKTIVSAIHPSIPCKSLLRILRPDLVLVQTNLSMRVFQRLGYKTEFLPNGVDVERFKPIDSERRKELRNEYGLPEDKKIIVHLASFTEKRNLLILSELQDKGTQVVIVGREKEKIDMNVVSSLQSAGCKIWIRHFSKIEEILGIADCYVFPTVDPSACIETPLSILEAMSCNLPIITTRFGSIPELFEEGEGLRFFNDRNGLKEAFASVDEVRTRQKVSKLSWENIIRKLNGIYENQVGVSESRIT